MFSQDDNKSLDVGGNKDGSKGFISQITYAFNEETNKYTSVDASGLQNGYDYRGDIRRIWKHHIEAWNGEDPLRFDLTYIDSSGNELIDYYYYDSINGASNQPTDEKLAGEADLVVVNEDDGNSQEDIAKETSDLFKGLEYTDGNFNLSLFSQNENKYLDVGGNEDGSKGYISQVTYAYNEETNKYTSIDASYLQNGDDYRGKTLRIWNYWIEEWNEEDPLRFDLTYIDSSGN